MARRGANEGTIRQRPDGRWEARVLLTDGRGVRRRRSLLARTQKDVIIKLQTAQQAETAGLPAAPARLTVAAYLDQWLSERVTPKLRPATVRSYTGIVKTHLRPGLGHHKLARLTPQQVQVFLNAKAASGLAPRTVGTLRCVLRKALTDAERVGYLTRNVAKLAEPPRVPHRSVQSLTPDQARALLLAIRGDRFEALYLIAVGVGLRQGENPRSWLVRHRLRGRHDHGPPGAPACRREA